VNVEPRRQSSLLLQRSIWWNVSWRALLLHAKTQTTTLLCGAAAAAARAARTAVSAPTASTRAQLLHECQAERLSEYQSDFLRAWRCKIGAFRAGAGCFAGSDWPCTPADKQSELYQAKKRSTQQWLYMLVQREPQERGLSSTDDFVDVVIW